MLAAVEKAAAALFPPNAIPDAIRDDSVPLPVLESAVCERRLWVAVDGAGRAVGFALMLVEGGYALLGEVDVMPEHGRKGLGRRLAAEVVRRARDEGHDAVYLTTFSHVPWNMPFYEQIGFSVLQEAETPSVLKDALNAERGRGMRHRVAMRMPLA